MYKTIMVHVEGSPCPASRLQAAALPDGTPVPLPLAH
jgi:hypothetical protein